MSDGPKQGTQEDAPQSPANGRWRVPWAALLAMALLGWFEFSAAREDWFWAWVPRSQVGVIDALETQVLAGSNPQILFTGSSRVRDAIAPRQLEKRLHLAEGSVLNLGLTMGTPFDAEILYRRNREKLRRAKLVFFGVEPFQLDKSNAPTERVLRYGTLRDRVALLGRRNRLHRTVGFFWRTLDTGPAMRRFLKSWATDLPEEPALAPDGRVMWRTEEDNKRARRRRTKDDADRFFKRWRPSPNRQEQLSRLLHLFADDGMTVVVIQIPARDTFWNYVHDKYPEQVKEYGKRVREASASHDVYLFWNGSDHGLRSGAFYDYGHLKNRSANRFTRSIADLIVNSYPEPLERARAEAPGKTPPPRAKTGAKAKARARKKKAHRPKPVTIKPRKVGPPDAKRPTDPSTVPAPGAHAAPGRTVEPKGPR